MPSLTRHMMYAHIDMLYACVTLQVQIIDRVVEMPVLKERQCPMVSTVQKTVEIPQVQIIDVVMDVPVVMERMCPMIST
eukprot:4050684-Amphidinium_carterae.1